MAVLLVRAAAPADALVLASQLREADLREIHAATGRPPVEVLTEGVLVSLECHAVVDELGDLVALFGVRHDSLHHRAGLVWLLSSDRLVQHAYYFLRQCRGWIQNLHERYDVLWNVVDARNVVHLRWLSFCRFVVSATINEYGPTRTKFHVVAHYAKEVR